MAHMSNTTKIDNKIQYAKFFALDDAVSALRAIPDVPPQVIDELHQLVSDALDESFERGFKRGVARFERASVWADRSRRIP